MRIIFASNNKHKLEEVKMILPTYALLIFSLEDIGINVNPEETGKTFKENAEIKADCVYKEMISQNKLQEGDIIISDDTGLCIDYFDGAPGIYSARFMGEETAQIEKNRKIVEEMKNLPYERRKATFFCDICKIENGKKSFFEGKFNGLIAKSINGEQGFGYDPIFVPEGEVNTVAYLGEDYKTKHSHRAKALNQAFSNL